jgi:hypothetical protein
MGDHQRGSVAHQLFQRALYQRLAFGVQRGGRLVQQQQRRVAQDGPCDRDALTLAAGQGDAALAQFGFNPPRQPTDEFAGVGEGRRVFDLDIAGEGPSKPDVLPRACSEEWNRKTPAKAM